MHLIRALRLQLEEQPIAVITEYQLGRLIYQLYLTKEYQGEIISLSKTYADQAAYNRTLKRLLAGAVLNRSRRLPKQMLEIQDLSPPHEAVIACTSDPFAYISHHSAMVHHELALKKSATLYLTSPDPATWRQHAEQTMQLDLDQEYQAYLTSGLPRLTRVRLDKIGKIGIRRYSPKKTGDYTQIPEKAIAVATIGQTFLDMLRHPEWSGGMKHVLRVFDKFGARYLSNIVQTFDVSGNGIDKVRAGYLLEERLAINDASIDSWAKFAQRGGSRKLDPTAEYLPVWSEKWCLSLNI